VPGPWSALLHCSKRYPKGKAKGIEMTDYDAALMECFIEHRPVTIVIYKAGFLIRINDA